MSDIPSELLREILLRLPAQFKIVCKSWRLIIDDPSFVKSHANTQIPSTTILIRGLDGFYFLSLDPITNPTEDLQTICARRIKTLVRRGVPRFHKLPAPSCNGMILISHHDWYRTWVVWNPLTKEFLELPEPGANLLSVGCCGLGYDLITDDYKVVRIDRIFRDRTMVYKTFVYSLKFGCWRMAKDWPRERLRVRMPTWCEELQTPVHGIFVNGALHWRLRDVIVVFNLGTEDYQELPLPPLPSKPDDSLHIYFNELGGFLALSCFKFDFNSLDVWVMKADGVENKWVKLFSLSDLDIHIKCDIVCLMRPIVYLKSKGVVILHSGAGLFWLDIENNFVKKIVIDGLTHTSSSSQNFRGGLFRLGVGGSVEGNIVDGVKRKRKKTNARFQFPVTIPDVMSLELEVIH